MIPIKCPYKDLVVGEVGAMTKEQVDQAIQKAKKAQKMWMELSKQDRSDILERWSQLLKEQVNELANLIMLEVGKTFQDAKKEVVRSAEYITFTNQEYLHLHAESIAGDNFSKDYRNKIGIVEREPLGLILAISPFNYPVNLSISKIAPALITGNAVIFKPATQGSLCGKYITELLYQAGLPKDVMPVITGRGSEIGDYITAHPGIDMISFTGSTAVGKNIAKLASGKPVVLELGGKDAALVLSKDKIDQAVDEILKGSFSYSAQRCTAIKRIIVLEDLYYEFTEKLIDGMNQLTCGSPEDNAIIVPLISTGAADFVEQLICDAKEQGAKVMCGGGRHENLIEPTLISNVTRDMKIFYEEPFGPVVPVLKAKTTEEAVALANDTPYGLQASVFTNDISLAFHIARKIDVGSVQINGKTERGPDNLPFLGVKDSGLGVQGVRSSIESMTRLKVYVINI